MDLADSTVSHLSLSLTALEGGLPGGLVGGEDFPERRAWARLGDGPKETQPVKGRDAHAGLPKQPERSPSPLLHSLVSLKHKSHPEALLGVEGDFFTLLFVLMPPDP